MNNVIPALFILNPVMSESMKGIEKNKFVVECQKYLMETSEANLNNLRSEIGKMSPLSEVASFFKLTTSSLLNICKVIFHTIASSIFMWF